MGLHSLSGSSGPKRPLIGVIHLLPLPGSPRARPMDEVLRRALADATAYAKGGAHGLIVENYGDAPFTPDTVDPHVPAMMAVIASEIRRRARLPLGLNVLRNDARAALAAATAAGASFIRVNVHTGAMMTDQGLIQGRAHETLQYRRRLDAPVAIFADVLVKHAAPVRPVSLAQAARETAYRGLADVLLVTGSATGEAPEPQRLDEIKSAVPDRPVFVASGVTSENARAFRRADGFIVGTWGKKDGRTENPVDAARFTRLSIAVRSVI
ncbi:MAG: BtpA/SgcQ family protein [Planctomycetes bacterium]|nr:BtpA/SgcQ family protein [Planctomycetota bacterium]